MRFVYLLFILALNSPATASNLSEHVANDLKNEVLQAHSKYLTGNLESRKTAMLTLSKLLESIEANTRNKIVGPNTLAVTYIRLGILAKESNDLTEAGKYFNQGLTSYHLNDKEMTMETLVETTYMLDNFAREYRTIR